MCSRDLVSKLRLTATVSLGTFTGLKLETESNNSPATSEN
jgi:hypothetical protein